MKPIDTLFREAQNERMTGDELLIPPNSVSLNAIALDDCYELLSSTKSALEIIIQITTQQSVGKLAVIVRDDIARKLKQIERMK